MISLDVVIPIFFLDLFSILVAFILVVLIETIVIIIFTKEKFLRLLSIVTKANIITTIIGYLIQSILRLILGGTIGWFISEKYQIEITNYKIANILFSNYSVESIERLGLSWEIILNLSFSLLICFLLSFIIEYKIIKRKNLNLNKNMTLKNVILLANAASYIFLFIWIMISYKMTLK